MLRSRFLLQIEITLDLVLYSALVAVAQPGLAAAASGPFASKFQVWVNNHAMAGAVFLVATKEKILDEEAVGYSDLATKTPMSIDDEFWIASMTKPITAAALMMLVDEGKVSIDDPVEKYLPEFKGQMVEGANGGPPLPPTHPILIREILSHTSGLANLPDDLTLPLSQRVSSYAHSLLETQPGTHFRYVNAGINTVGRIIEVVSGMPYEKFVQERILIPLGMSDTTFWPDAGQITRLAAAYQEAPDNTGLEKVANPFVPDPGKPRVYVLPAGGLFSTAADLLKFCRMMLQQGVFEGKRYLSQSSVAAMTKLYTTPTTGGSYGLAWMISPNSFYHDGAFKTRMAIVPSEGLVEIFLVQISKPLPAGADQFINIFTRTAEESFGEQSTPAVAPH